MTRKRVGYFEGTDSTLLTSLVCQGYDTLPVSNGYDNHGRHVRLINEENRYDVLVGYVHKIYAPDGREDPNYTTFQDIFHVCQIHSVPLLLEVPAELHDKVQGLFGEPPDIVRFIDPDDMLEACLEILAD
jgi:hypothetical protein